MNKRITTALAGGLASLAIAIAPAKAQDELTLCWAAWDPANALVELSKDFTAETGIGMKFEFVPWTNFADRFLNELNSGGKLCDLLIGDSQWIGGSAENGHYVKLNDFFDAEGISMDDFLPATVYAYSTWPKGSPNYWALPAMGDALGWVYRRDWFERPELQAEFKEKHGRDLAPPKTWTELREVSEFFQEREIDGKKVYGAAIYTERGSEGITMGVTAAMYSWGFQYENPDKPYDMQGYVNSPAAAQALAFYKGMYECCSPPGHSDAYMVANLDAYKSGQVAMQMNWFAFFPGIAKDPRRRWRSLRLLRQPEPEDRGFDAGRPGDLRGLLLRQEGSGAAVHQVVRQAGRPEEMVVAGRVLVPQRRSRRSGLRRHRAVRRRLPQGDVGREGLLAGACLRLPDAVDAETRPRLRGRRQGNRAGSPRQDDRGLDRDLRGRR